MAVAWRGENQEKIQKVAQNYMKTILQWFSGFELWVLDPSEAMGSDAQYPKTSLQNRFFLILSNFCVQISLSMESLASVAF